MDSFALTSRHVGFEGFLRTSYICSCYICSCVLLLSHSSVFLEKKPINANASAYPVGPTTLHEGVVDYRVRASLPLVAEGLQPQDL